MAFHQQRASTRARKRFFDEEAAWNHSPVKIETLIKYKALPTQAFVYKDSTGRYHHLNISINDGEHGVQQALLHVHHFSLHTSSHVFPTRFDHRQFFAMTLSSTASDKWAEVCVELPEAAHDMEATLKAFVKKDVSPESNLRLELKDYCSHSAKKRHFQHLPLSRFIVYFKTLNALIPWLPGSMTLDAEGNETGDEMPLKLSEDELKNALYYGMPFSWHRRFLEMHYRLHEKTLHEVEDFMLEKEGIASAGRAPQDWLDMR
jgi:hypothetical protein